MIERKKKKITHVSIIIKKRWRRCWRRRRWRCASARARVSWVPRLPTSCAAGKQASHLDTSSWKEAPT